MKKISAMLICVFLLGTQILDFEFQKDSNQIVIIFREPAAFVYPEGGRPPDKIWKEVYGVKDGRLILLNKADGKHAQPMWIEEKIIFEKLE